MQPMNRDLNLIRSLSEAQLTNLLQAQFARRQRLETTVRSIEESTRVYTERPRTAVIHEI